VQQEATRIAAGALAAGARPAGGSSAVGRSALGCVVDITDREAVQACFADIVKRLGPVYCLVGAIVPAGGEEVHEINHLFDVGEPS
jgi:NAD(P)-dependent dehydrogenase (short-subunit alcohol dehydrogenase family)